MDKRGNNIRLLARTSPASFSFRMLCHVKLVGKSHVQPQASSARVNLPGESPGDEADWTSPLASANRTCRDLANKVFFSCYYSFIIICSASKIATKLNFKYAILGFHKLKALKKTEFLSKSGASSLNFLVSKNMILDLPRGYTMDKLLLFS